jgi:hypothetical protein
MGKNAAQAVATAFRAAGEATRAEVAGGAGQSVVLLMGKVIEPLGQPAATNMGIRR